MSTVDQPESAVSPVKTTHVVETQTKRFYIDLKRGTNGKWFIKLVESRPKAYPHFWKQRIGMTLKVAEQFITLLKEFNEFYETLGSEGDTTGSRTLKAEKLELEHSTYFFDFRENSRGRFLRVALVRWYWPRVQIAIPAAIMSDIRNEIIKALDVLQLVDADPKVDESPTKFPVEYPESGVLPVESKLSDQKKTFYFDMGKNKRGEYLRISEVRFDRRFNITVPLSVLSEFENQICRYIEWKKKLDSSGFPEPDKTKEVSDIAKEMQSVSITAAS